MIDHRKRIVWITGASTGIGRALAETFALKGDLIIASARTESKLLDLQQKIHSTGGICDIIGCDVQSEVSVQSAAQKIFPSYGCIDVLINNAGVTYFKDFISTTVEEFDHVVNTNLRGVFLTTRAVLPTMLQHKSGLVINIISYTTKEVYTKSAAYAASKAGVEAMMNVLRAEVRRQGINVVNVYPGAVMTDIWHPKHQEKFGTQMLTSFQVANFVYEISIQPQSVMIEECVIRPQIGDLSL